MKLMIYFSNDQDKVKVTNPFALLIRHAAIAALEHENVGGQCELSITFTDDEGIRAVNRQYRGIDKATDVLSFPLTDYEGTDEPPMDDPEQSLGDIMISLERA